MSKGVTFYFVRHGETYFNRFGRMQGWSNAPLTDEGIKNIHRSGKGLANVQFDAVYTSDLMRTIDTATIILEENHYADGLSLHPMKEFREVHFGYFEGLPSEDIWPKVMDEVKVMHDLPKGTDPEIQTAMDLVKKFDPYHYAESYSEFWQRVEAGLLTLLNKHAGTDENVLVVCHGMTIRNLLHGLVADFNETEPLDNASVSIVEYKDGHFTLSAYGQTDHFTDVAEAAGK